MRVADVALGTNLGDRLGHLIEAIRLLEQPHTRVVRVSSVYETAPQGITDQPSFLNMVAQVETELSPQALLQHLQGVEKQLGRVRRERWGPRTIDLDILLYGTLELRSPELEIPHPRMADRAFVVMPLMELEPTLSLPGIAPAEMERHVAHLAEQGIAPYMGADSFLQRVRGVQ